MKSKLKIITVVFIISLLISVAKSYLTRKEECADCFANNYRTVCTDCPDNADLDVDIIISFGEDVDLRNEAFEKLEITSKSFDAFYLSPLTNRIKINREEVIDDVVSITFLSENVDILFYPTIKDER
ncbi:MAG: hypothetical protein ACK5KQ_04740 [Anaerorhabdus sp.]